MKLDYLQANDECGVTDLYPFECTGRTDIVKIRKQFPCFQIFGGIDKKQLALGRAEIDEELERKIPHVWNTGGFIPFVDHTVPPDVSWDNFRYYRSRVEKEQVIPERASTCSRRWEFYFMSKNEPSCEARFHSGW